MLKTFKEQELERNQKFEQYNKKLNQTLKYNDNGLIKSEKETNDMFEGFKDDFKPAEDGNFNQFEKRIMDVMNGVGKYPTTDKCNNQYKIQKQQEEYIPQPVVKNSIDNMIDELVNNVGKTDQSIYQQEQMENDDIQSYYDEELSNFKSYLDNTKHSFEFF